MTVKMKQLMSIKLFVLNLFKLLFINIIKIYQRFISPFFPSSCKFSPSCSKYGIEAINKYGAIKGLILTVKRILKCNPWSKGGYDPIP
jgi:putative membrane protein insertion efficiency factor